MKFVDVLWISEEYHLEEPNADGHWLLPELSRMDFRIETMTDLRNVADMAERRRLAAEAGDRVVRLETIGLIQQGTSWTMANYMFYQSLLHQLHLRVSNVVITYSSEE